LIPSKRELLALSLFHFVPMSSLPLFRTVAPIALFALMLGFQNHSLSAAPTASPNVVIILTDDLGYGDLSSYGQEAYETPEIDRLAREGVLATDYYVPVPYCAPSRAALLTGRFPFRNGMVKNPHPDLNEAQDNVGLAATELTLGEVYQSAGYKTAAFGKWHLGHKPQFYPTRHGFDEYYGILYSNDMLPIQIMDGDRVAENPVDQRYLTRKYTDKAVDFITRNQDQPFFLYLPHAMPHKPLAASEDYYTPDTPNDLYHDVIRELDGSVGEIIAALHEHGILENTIVIFTSDNGPHYGGSTGGFKGKKATPWEGGIRVPFIIRHPASLPAGTTVSTPFWSIDLFATLLGMTGIDLPPGITLDGSDIRDILTGKTKTHAPIYSAQDTKIITIRDGDWKLYVNKPHYLSTRDLNPDWVDPTWPNGTTIIAQTEQPNSMQYPGIVPKQFENPLPLFNLASDPTESTDLAAVHPAVVARLRAEYERFLASMPAME
jgi:arylsulfatase A-like enzyme